MPKSLNANVSDDSYSVYDDDDDDDHDIGIGTCLTTLTTIHSLIKVNWVPRLVQHRRARNRVLVALGIRHYEIFCNCFPRRIYFHRVLGDLATYLVLGGHEEAIKIDFARTGIRTSDL
ncbi:hypothetical protein PoB_003244400 [Plakobranchus ocellatus]|uniref:Uncharacterized protein n=1 Tax=Plakobranchus ocellatus TaxID=259542 RepID=A0AAV4AI55_9GAST|nr:hypothetical protein PoB_003244400 [Plakobranchus ocellatus]